MEKGRNRGKGTRNDAERKPSLDPYPPPLFIGDVIYVHPLIDPLLFYIHLVPINCEKKEEIEEKEVETMPNESHVCLFWHSPMVISAFANKPRYDERQNGSFLPARWLAGSKQ